MEKIKDLQELLRMENVKDVKSRFEEIADMSFQDFHIEKEGVRYDFLEVEFYFYNEKHPDFITYPRNTKAGEWFFHMSGVDISFKSEKEEREGKEIAVRGGGILVRSILKEGEKTPITGPYKCMDELFDKFDAFGTNLENFPILKPNERKNEYKPKSCIRWIPPYTGKPDKEKIEGKNAELSKRYPGIFESRKDEFQKIIKEAYRYYRDDNCFMNMTGYQAKPPIVE